MKVRVFYPNKDNKIEFTKQQLEKLLDEVYEEGRAKGYDQGYAAGRPVTITYPYTPFWYTTTDTIPTITCNGGDYTTTSTTATSGYVTINNMNYADGSISIGDEK